METTELEALVVAVQDGSRPRTDLMAALLVSRVAVLYDRGLEGDRLSPDARPLTLNSPAGHPVLATFTSVEKSAPWVKNEPAFSHALHTGFDGVLAMMPTGFGIALNPGYQWSFLLSPDEVQALKLATGGAAAAAD